MYESNAGVHHRHSIHNSFDDNVRSKCLSFEFTDARPICVANRRSFCTSVVTCFIRFFSQSSTVYDSIQRTFLVGNG